jgi:sialate O-acetylesterase
MYESYEQSSEISDVKLNYSSLYNAMIHPFTRMVIYGVIWYQGESNSGRNTDKYSCTFSNLIRFWRQAWNERTNNITDVQFPFGFVQVKKIYLLICKSIHTFSWLHWEIQQIVHFMVIHGYVGYVPNNVVPKVFMAVTLDLRDDPAEYKDNLDFIVD